MSGLMGLWATATWLGPGSAWSLSCTSDPRSSCPFHPRLIYLLPHLPSLFLSSVSPFVPPSQPPKQLLTSLFILGFILGLTDAGVADAAPDLRVPSLPGEDVFT